MKGKYHKTMQLSDWLTIIGVFGGLALIVALILVKLCGGLNIPFSDGQRTGLVYKISKKGIIWKTWEGEMSMQMLERNTEGQLVPKVFAFSVTSEAVAKEIETASASGKPITIAYKQYFLRGFDDGSTQYDATSVKTTEP